MASKSKGFSKSSRIISQLGLSLNRLVKAPAKTATLIFVFSGSACKSPSIATDPEEWPIITLLSKSHSLFKRILLYLLMFGRSLSGRSGTQTSCPKFSSSDFSHGNQWLVWSAPVPCKIKNFITSQTQSPLFRVWHSPWSYLGTAWSILSY